MGVKARLEDAMILWDQGRKEGAWVLVLVAAAATSRKRYPRATHADNVSFKKFIRDVQDTILYGNHPARPTPPIIFAGVAFEDLMYLHMRNNLVHEAELNAAVALSESKVIAGNLQADLRVGAVNEIPDFWVIHLAKAVRLAPENASEFTGPAVAGTWSFW